MTTALAPETIAIRGAREHNLRDVDLDLPRDQLVVVTGLSGSGKSSLAFDTIYAEGQRRYVESLSAYARQFLDQMSKPDVDAIEGLSPAISIEQKTVGRSPRSTVGTTTEISDYLRLLFARAGEPHCWSCGRPISSQTVGQMAERVLALGEGARVTVMAPIVRGRRGSYKKELDQLRSQGYVRARIDGELVDLGDEVSLARGKRHDIDVVIDRIIVKDSARTRIAESIETATGMADGLVTITTDDEEWGLSQANACSDCGVSFPELAPRMFSFNSPAGACDACSGLGVRGVFDPERVAPEPDAPLSDAIAPWRGGKRRAKPYYRKLLSALADHAGVDLETPWGELPPKVREFVLFGSGEREIEIPVSGRGRSQKRQWDGVLGELGRRVAADPDEAKSLERYTSPLPCDECEGTRLRLEARSVKLGGHTLPGLSQLPLDELGPAIDGLRLGGADQTVADRVLFEIRERIRFLCDVGLGYLTLDRASTTLSGGESQRIRLATQIGASLMGVLYILDEPSIGLHPRDHGRLLASLEKLRDQGNSILVVEHDEDTMRRADWLVDMGPAAGIEGGRVVAQGSPEEVMKSEASLTGAYLSGAREIAPRAGRRTPATGKDARELVVEGCTQHNLKDVTLRIPLGLFTVVTGVSGSGKSTLVGDTLQRALSAKLYGAKEPPGRHTALRGLEHLEKVVDVSQAPIGRTPRSNPATYSGALDGIRKLMSGVPEARARGYGPGRFSFNVKGGRCEDCQGDGSIRVEMNFLPDLFVTCEVCQGRRFNRETLEITYKGLSIADILELSVDEATRVFENVGFVHRPLEALRQVGLGYVHLGQAATTLSGGEAQRIKLARELQKKSSRSTGKTLYLLDEPTTGLHFADVEKLLELLHALVDRGDTVVVVEHQLDVVRSADHVIDLGPEGGDGGGEIVAEGPPEAIMAEGRSHTGRALAEATLARGART